LNDNVLVVFIDKPCEFEFVASCFGNFKFEIRNQLALDAVEQADRIDDASRRNGTLAEFFELESMWQRLIWRSELQRVLELILPPFQPQQIIKSLSASRPTLRLFSSQFIRVMLAEVQNSFALSNVVIIQRLLFWIIADQHACIFHLFSLIGHQEFTCISCDQGRC
jgi:hypothetical protein